MFEVVSGRRGDGQQQRLVPPSWFMDRLNITRAGLGLPVLSPADPLALYLWHQATAPPPLAWLRVSGVC